jgi:hypothetical protein
MTVEQKKLAKLFMQEGKKTTLAIQTHIAKYIDGLNAQFRIDQIYVRRQNEAAVREKFDIRQTPTLLLIMGHRETRFTDTHEIIKLLTPMQDTRDLANISSEEQTSRYFAAVMGQGDNDDHADMDKADMQARMADMQRKREPMQGVDKKNLIEGGRAIRPKPKAGALKAAFNDDADFRAASGRDEITDTPTDDGGFDGALCLEEERNAIADMEGRKRNVKPIRWSGR